MAALINYLESFSRSIPSYSLVKTYPIGLAGTAILSAPLIYFVRVDYRAWYLLGRAGPPHNIFGWLFQLLVTPLRAPRFDTSCFDNPRTIAKAGPPGGATYLSPKDVPQRTGSRPSVYKWILPQRQADNRSSSEWKTGGASYLTAFTNHSKLTVSTSLLERSGPALFLPANEPRHSGAHYTRGEIAHLHPLDGSLHVSLAPKDAKLVIEREWGERFGLSGTLVPATYIMVYAPRTCEENY